jgi:heme A synthase
MLKVITIATLFYYVASILPLYAYVKSYEKKPVYKWIYIPLMNFVLLFSMAGFTPFFAAGGFLIIVPLAQAIFFILYVIAWFKISMKVQGSIIISSVIALTRLFPIDFGIFPALYFMASDEILGKNKKK